MTTLAELKDRAVSFEGRLSAIDVAWLFDDIDEKVAALEKARELTKAVREFASGQMSDDLRYWLYRDNEDAARYSAMCLANDELEAVLPKEE